MDWDRRNYPKRRDHRGGSVIAAGAVVTKDVPPYTIYISENKQKRRFNDEQIMEHEKRLMEF